MPNFSSFRWEMTEIYRKDRPTDIVMYRGNYSQLKNIFCSRLNLYHLESHHAKFQFNRSRNGWDTKNSKNVWWWVGGGWVPSKNLVTSDRLVRVSRSRSESVTIKRKRTMIRSSKQTLWVMTCHNGKESWSYKIWLFFELMRKFVWWCVVVVD